MPATTSADFVFEPKVWSDHVKAYFDKMLVFGAFAVRNNELQAEGSGLTVNFPYFKAIGDAEEIAENASLTVDSLSDDSFSATVFEVGKAVGFTKKAFKKSAASQEKILAEATSQIGRVHAEKVDAKLLAEIETSHTAGFTATADANLTTIKVLNTAKVKAFGDKHMQATVCFMHSLQMLDLQNDPTAGFMKADANDPMNMIQGYAGKLLGMNIVVNDQMTAIAPAGGITLQRHRAIICKEGAYGIMSKQEMEFDTDKDILAREIYITGNEWYAVKNFDKKISNLDKKIASFTTTVSA
jgi:hypothetical protein